MLSFLVQVSLRHRGVLVALACVLCGYGAFVASRAPLDVFPDFVPPQVTIQTEAPGLTPEQVETRVTTPIELAVNGLGNLESLRSESIEGLSIITAVFREGGDVLRARQMMGERLAELSGRLPAGVHAPRLTPLTSSTMDLLKVGLVSESLTPTELRAVADWTLRPLLLAVPGVAKCSTFGGEVRQWQVQVRPEALAAHQLTLADVVAAARTAASVHGAGFIETQNQRILIQADGPALTTEQLGRVVVRQTNAVPLRLRDVARIVEGAEPKHGDALVQGRPGVLLTLSSQYGANTLEVTRDLEKALGEVQPELRSRGIQVFPRLHRPATFIESALANIRTSLAVGGALVAVVLFLCLGNLRVAAISVTAIPLSLLSAVILLDKFGVTLNTITLGGLAIAIGEVVDDAIIDAENILRRLRENQASPQPRPAMAVVLEASLEVRTAVVYATFIVGLVFLPVLGLTGLQGKFFGPLAVSYLSAILASLGVALTLTPALALLLFGRRAPAIHEPRVQRGLKAVYGRVLSWLMPHPYRVLAGMGLLFVAAVWQLPRPGGEILPRFREGHFVLQASATPGTSLPEMRRIGGQISRALLELPGIATVEQQIGRAELGEDPWGPHRSEFHVELQPMSPDAEEAMEGKIRDVLTGFPGLQTEVLTFLGDRIGETLTGETAPVVLSLFGPDLDILDAKAREVATVLQAIPGAADVRVKSPPGSPRIAVRLRPDRLTALGFWPGDVLASLETAYQGTTVGQAYEGSRVTDVTVVLDEVQRRDPERLGELLLRGLDGTAVPLRELAELQSETGRSSILHDGARRRQAITCNPQGRNLADWVAEARSRLAERIRLPPGTYWTLTGAVEASRQARHELLLHSGIALVGIVLLLVLVLRSAQNVLLVMLNLPLALAGGVLALRLEAWGAGPEASGLGMGAMVGFVTLFGITLRNSIMLIAHYEHLVTREGAAWDLTTAARGASERLMPILLTAAVTGLGLLPLALGSGEPGREIEGPMAQVILGGLVTSTILSLLVLPPLAGRLARFGSR